MKGIVACLGLVALLVAGLQVRSRVLSEHRWAPVNAAVDASAEMLLREVDRQVLAGNLTIESQQRQRGFDRSWIARRLDTTVYDRSAHLEVYVGVTSVAAADRLRDDLVAVAESNGFHHERSVGTIDALHLVDEPRVSLDIRDNPSPGSDTARVVSIKLRGWR